jgi:hypothetical protein
MGSGFDDFIYWHFFSIAVDYNISQSVFSRTLLPWPPRPVFILLLFLRLTANESSLMLRPTVQSASLSWNKAPIWGLRTDLYYCQTVAGLLMWGALSEERTGLSAGPRQHSDSQVRVFWDSVRFSQSYVTTDGQSASGSWNKAPIWGLRSDFYYCQTVANFLMWGALSDERTGLPFIIAAGPRQRSHSWVWAPRNSWPYFTVSDSRLFQPGGPGPRIYEYLLQEQGGPVIPQALGFLSSPPTTRSATVEVFEPASTRGTCKKSMSKLCYDRRSVGQSVLVSSIHLGLTTRFVLLSTCQRTRCLL